MSVRRLRQRAKGFLALSALIGLALPGLAEEVEAHGDSGRDRGVDRDHPRERAEWNAMLRRDNEGRVVSENRLKALGQACEMPVDPSMAPAMGSGAARSGAAPSTSAGFTSSGIVWQSLGPRPIQSRTFPKVSFGYVSGRADCLALHPADSSTLLLGAATGGIWKSTDAGASWRPVSDTAPALATSSIAFAPSNPSIAFAATGEADKFGSESVSGSLGTYLGAGLLKSVDGGESWVRIDSTQSGALPPEAILSKVVVHPANPQQVLVAVFGYLDIAAGDKPAGGIYRSTDGGVHFTRTFAQRVSDLVQDPLNNSRVFLAAANCSNCQPSGVHVSDDFGRTWSPSLTPSTPGATFTSPTGKIKLGVAGSGGSTVLYASVLDTNGTHSGGGIFRSANGGTTWAKASVHPSMCPPLPARSQCSYDHWITPADGSSSTVYSGSVDLYKSTDGAATWTRLTDIHGGSLGVATIHADQHAGVTVPGSPSTLYIANDGGLYRTVDGAQTFESLNATLDLTQLNSIALHPTDPDFAMGGTQDNANIRYTGEPMWTAKTGLDGGFNAIRSDDPTQIFSAQYEAFFTASTDGGATFRDVNPCGVLMNCNGALDPHVQNLEPMAFYVPGAVAPSAPGMVFIGTNRIWGNPVFGQDPSAWQPRSASPITSATGDFLTAIATVGDGSGPFWAGSSTGAVLFSTDGGATFSPRTSGLPSAIVSRILAVTPDGRSAYVTFGGFSGSPSSHIFRTNDAGMTWTNISSNLPDIPIISLVIDPTDPADLLAGSDVGVFRSTNGGGSWATFSQGLPNVSVYDLKFHPTTGDLWAATYGRGVWRIKAPVGGTPPTASFTFSANPNAGQPVQFTDTSTGSPTSWLWDFGDGGTSTAQNPTHTYAAAGSYQVSLTVTNAAGPSTKTQTVTVAPAIAGSTVTKVVPIVLDVSGVGGAHFSTELTLANRGTTTATLQITYVPATSLGASGGGTAGETLPAGRQVVFPDAIAYLRGKGLTIPTGSGQGGALFVTFEGLSSADVAFAGARTTAPSGSGRAGLAYPGVRIDEGFTVKAYVFGLRENAADRSNLALVNMNAAEPITLRVTLISGTDGTTSILPDVTLAGGQWTQIGRVLSLAGFVNGFALVELVSGPGPFYTYGVFNDNSTADGSFVPPTVGSGDARSILPVLVETSTFQSELVLTNPYNQPSVATMTYLESLTPAGGTGGVATENLGPYEQKIIPSAVDYLRGKGVSIGTPGAASYAGAVQTTFHTPGGSFIYGFVGARTSAPANGGGQYGLFYRALLIGENVQTEAWVFGLQQNGTNRSNLAVVNYGNGTGITFRLDVYDGDTGKLAGSSSVQNLPVGGWFQFSPVLASFGVRNGYVRVVRVSGNSLMLAYGVVNDGAAPGSGATNDGSYVVFSNR